MHACMHTHMHKDKKKTRSKRDGTSMLRSGRAARIQSQQATLIPMIFSEKYCTGAQQTACSRRWLTSVDAVRKSSCVSYRHHTKYVKIHVCKDTFCLRCFMVYALSPTTLQLPEKNCVYVMLPLPLLSNLPLWKPVFTNLFSKNQKHMHVSVCVHVCVNMCVRAHSSVCVCVCRFKCLLSKHVYV